MFGGTRERQGCVLLEGFEVRAVRTPGVAGRCDLEESRRGSKKALDNRVEGMPLCVDLQFVGGVGRRRSHE